MDDQDDINIQMVIEQAKRLYPDICLYRLRMEPMITVSHIKGNAAQEQECSEFIVRELSREYFR